jgi:cell division protease FtsH
LIDAEVRRVLSDASARVTATLEGQRSKLEALSRMLLEKEVVDRHDLDMILAGNVTPMPPPKAEAGSHVSAPAPLPAQTPH